MRARRLLAGTSLLALVACPTPPAAPEPSAREGGARAPEAAPPPDAGRSAVASPPDASAPPGAVSALDAAGAPHPPAPVDPVAPIATAAPIRTCADTPPKGSSASWKACAVRGQCTLAYRTCCAPCTEVGQCGRTAVNVAFESALRAATCGPTPVGCPACASPFEPAVYASCRAGVCTAVDIRVDEVSRCAADSDCVARAADCCGPCGPGGLYVALRADAAAAYAADVCGKTKCAQCTNPPSPPRVVCGKGTRHCELAP